MHQPRAGSHAKIKAPDFTKLGPQNFSPTIAKLKGVFEVISY
jgi:hypothetical protein